MIPDNNHPAPDGRRDPKTRPENRNMQALHDKLDRLMAKTKPNKRELILHCFRDLYPKMEAYLAQGRPLKEVLAAFNELAQAKVCTRTFGDMLKDERSRRNQVGNPACCDACCRPLSPNGTGAPNATASTPTNSNSEE